MSSEKLYYKKYLKYKQKYKILQTQIGGSPNIDDNLKEIYKFLQKKEYTIKKFKVKNTEDYKILNKFLQNVTNYLIDIKNNEQLNTKIIMMYKSLLELKSYISAELLRVSDPNCYFPNFDVKLNMIKKDINDFQSKEEINGIDLLNYLRMYASTVKYNNFLHTVSNSKSKTIVDLKKLEIINKQDIDKKKEGLLIIQKNLKSLILTYLKNNGLNIPIVSTFLSHEIPIDLSTF